MGRHPRDVREASFYHSSIRSWPTNERPREKLLSRGTSALSEAELLAILLRTGAGGVTAVDLAKALLVEHGSLERLATRSIQELRRYRGVGETKAITVLAAFELGRRLASGRMDEKIQVQSPEDVVRIYQPLLRDRRQEIFKVLLLDSANHLLRDVEVSSGILNSALVHPREVFRTAISEPAASVILLHNHPSGNPEPSSEDLQITHQLVEAGRIIGIPVHDHIIVAEDRYTSFAERGIL